MEDLSKAHLLWRSGTPGGPTVAVRRGGVRDGELLGTPLSFLPAACEVDRPEGGLAAGRFSPPPGAIASRAVDLVAGGAGDVQAERFAWRGAVDLLERADLELAGPDRDIVRAIVHASADGHVDEDALVARLQAHARRTEGARSVELVPSVAVIPLRTPTLPPATHTNCVLLINPEDGAFVAIDPAPPDPSEQDVLLAAVESHAGRLAAVWLTHHHRDHVQAARRLADRFGVPVCAHRETAHLLAGACAVDRLIEAGAHLAVGRGAPWVRAIYTPGHAPGHLCFLDERSGTLVAGDMVAAVGTIVIDPPLGDMALYLDSLRALLGIGARRLVPAHGPATARVTAKLEGYIAHRIEREERVVTAMQAAGMPRSPIDLVPAAYPDVPPAVYPLAERSLRAHLEKLVREGRAQEGPPDRFTVRAP